MRLNKGWGFPGNAKKAHYFLDGQSIPLCGKWMFMGERFDDQHDHSDNCAVCMRKRLKLEEKKND